MATIANIGTFDPNYLTYIDFLDCLTRTASLYQFFEIDKAQYSTMDQKLEYLIGKLNDKYSGLVGPFIEIMAKREQDMRYQPRLVLDDEADDDDYDY